MKRYVIKQDSELYQRILKAEEALHELGLSITYENASDGIVIEDSHTGYVLKTIPDTQPEYSFPRTTEATFDVVTKREKL